MKARDAARTEVTSMLVISLVASGVLLIAANWVVRGKYPIVGTIGACAIAAVGPVFVMLVLKAVWIQAALLVVALLVLLVPRWGRWLYLPASVTATLVAYGITGHSALEEQREFDRLRERFAFESMEDRLPPRPPTASRPALADPARLTLLENSIDMGGTSRAESLQALHERQVQSFVNSPGFGVTRMMYFTGEDVKLGERPPVPQPGLGRDGSPPDRWEPVKGPWPDVHKASVLDFVNPAGFGWVKDRRHVAGFQKHGFSKVPDPADTWRVGTIDLIGLLLHPEPAAYVSANLPRMDELRDAPTRPLDPFEAEGLGRLRGGEELFVRGSDKQARMLGAVRATRQCLACHGGDRGDLLGAFSYTLRRGE
jgi:hypothetical protein